MAKKLSDLSANEFVFGQDQEQEARGKQERDPP